MKLKLEEKGLHKALEKDLLGLTDANKKKADAQARNLIMCKVEGVAFNMVKNLKNAHAMIIKLNNWYLASQDKEMRVTDLFKMWTKAQTFKGNTHADPNS